MNIKLDIACENLRKAISMGKVRPPSEEIKEKWELMASESAQKRALRMKRR